MKYFETNNTNIVFTVKKKKLTLASLNHHRDYGSLNLLGMTALMSS